ncbi:MAG: hypothetical protein EOM83_04290 [Clostridia bacterium]|nr:hypothetical protein [Clostridia bacterium]
MSVVTEYSGWFFILCIVLAVAYAGILYYRNPHEEFSAVLTRWLAAFRFLAIGLLAFLLLSPMLKTIFRTSEKPVIIFAQDNSASLTVGNDTAFYRQQYPQMAAALIDELQDDYEVKTFAFADKVTEGAAYDYNGMQTDMSALIDELLVRFANRNIGALIIASDGIYNHGVNPLYNTSRIKFPIYPVALGDTSVHRDLLVSKVNFNRIAFKGNTFPIEVLAEAHMLAGTRTTLTVTRAGNTLFSKAIEVTSDDFYETINLQLEANEAGLQRYNIRLAPVADEITTLNNSQDIFIDVLDARQKILILAAAPHPDIAALRSAIESNYNYEVDVKMAAEFDGVVQGYNLIVLHQLPSAKLPVENVLKNAANAKLPVLYVLGISTDINRFNGLDAGLRITANQVNFNEALPVLNPDFVLFNLSDDTRKAVNEWPPLVAPFGDYRLLTSASVLMVQKIGSLTTELPLVVFNQNLETRTGIVAGEGLWKWRLHNYLKNNNHKAFNEVVTRMIQYLAVKVNKRFFDVAGANNFTENEPVVLSAEVYNQSYEPINEPEVEITITNSDGDTYPFVFGKTARAYQLNAGALPVDNYTWEAKVHVGDKVFTDRGAFSISPLNIETINTRADHNLLYQLAEKTNGQMIYPDALPRLADALRQRADITTITYSTRQYTELVNLPWILILIIALLAAEWLLRKRNGSY